MAQNSILDWRAEFAHLEGAYAPATMRSYYSDVDIYVQWCAEAGRVAFPAEIAVLCAFLQAQAQEFAPATVRRRVYSIRKIHRLLHLPDPTGHEEVTLTLRRIRRAKLSRPKQAKGLTRPYLDRFLAAQPETPWGWRNRAMLALGYECLTRRSELVALRSEDLLWREDGTLRVIIRRSKADPYGQGRLASTSSRSRELVEAWLAWRGPDFEYLFCPIYQGRPVKRSLSCTSVKRLIKDAAWAAGLDASVVADFSGHSLRVGAAQDLLCAGKDTASIMRAGGWKSVNVLAATSSRPSTTFGIERRHRHILTACEIVPPERQSPFRRPSGRRTTRERRRLRSGQCRPRRHRRRSAPRSAPSAPCRGSPFYGPRRAGCRLTGSR